MKDYELVNKEFQEGTKVQGKYSLSSSEQDEKVQSAGKRAFLENNLEGTSGKLKAILENNGPFLKNIMTLLENKRATLGNKIVLLGKKRAILENKKAIFGIKRIFGK